MKEVKGGTWITLFTFVVALVGMAGSIAQHAPFVDAGYEVASKVSTWASGIDFSMIGMVVGVLAAAAASWDAWQTYRYGIAAAYIKDSFAKWLRALLPFRLRADRPLTVGPELREFYEMLDGHRWHAAFEYPKVDEQTVKASEDEFKMLERMGGASATHQALFEAFCQYAFTGDPWTQGSPSPKPVLALRQQGEKS
jgi:hypothetical protein